MIVAKTTLAAAALLAFSLSAAAQTGYPQPGYPQPYSPSDPNNYGSPASQQYGQAYPQQAQPQRYDPNASDPNAYNQDDQAYNQGQQAYEDAQAAPYAGQQTVAQAPPPIPEYEQPLAPGDGYLWTPGYWAFGPAGYYWVPGAWQLAPYTGALFTPGYWAYAPIGFYWNPGYWALNIGYYGGINYGYGYFGSGFYGGYWNGGRFCYNREYNRGNFNYGYNQRFPAVIGVHPGGRSFATGNRDGFRGGAFGQRGFTGSAGVQHAIGSYAQRGLESHGNTVRAGNSIRGTEAYGNRQQYPGGNSGYTNRQFPTGTYNRPTEGQSYGGHTQPRPVYSSPAGGYNRGAQPSFGAGGSGGGYHSAPTQTYHPAAPSGNYGGVQGGGGMQGGGGNRGGGMQGGGMQGGGGNRGHR